MLKQLVELARAKKQVNIAFTALTAEKFILGIAPANAGTDKIAPFMAKGTMQEIMDILQLSTKLPDYVTAALSKKPEPVKAADPDEEGDTEETDTTDTAKTAAVEVQERKCRVCGTVFSDGDNWQEEYLCEFCKPIAPIVPPPVVEPAPEFIDQKRCTKTNPETGKQCLFNKEHKDNCFFGVQDAAEPAPEAPAVPKQPTFNF
jgi:hypothetical protein